MNIEPADLIKIATLGASAGGFFSLVKPFALHLFQRWLASRDKQDEVFQKVADEQVNMTLRLERVIGVLEAQHQNAQRIEKRLDRIEGAMGIVAGTSDIPPPLAPIAPRQHISVVDPEELAPAAPPHEHRAPRSSSPGRLGINDSGRFRPVAEADAALHAKG
jgi:hypothetical protein